MNQMEMNQNTEDLIQKIVSGKEAMQGLQGSSPVTTQITDGWIQLIPIIQQTKNSSNVNLYNVGKWFRDIQSAFRQSSKSLKESNNFYMQSQTNRLMRIGYDNPDQISTDELEIMAEGIAEGACVGEVVDPLGQSINLDIFQEMINKIFTNKYIMRWFFQNQQDYGSQLKAQWSFFTSIMNQKWVEEFIFEKAYRTDANTIAKSDLAQMGCKQLKFKEYKQRVEARLQTMEDGPQKKREADALKSRIARNQIKKEASLKLEQERMKTTSTQKDSKTKTKFEQKSALQKRRPRDDNKMLEEFFIAYGVDEEFIPESEMQDEGVQLQEVEDELAQLAKIGSQEDQIAQGFTVEKVKKLEASKVALQQSLIIKKKTIAKRNEVKEQLLKKAKVSNGMVSSSTRN